MLNRVTHRDRITATQLAANLGLPSFSDLGQHLNTDNGWQEGTHATTPHPAANAVRLDGRATPAGAAPRLIRAVTAATHQNPAAQT